LLGHPPAVFRDMGGIVVRPEAAIEAGIDAAGDAALAGEKGVAQARNGREQRRSQRHRVSTLAVDSASVSPAIEVRWGSEIATTLNIEPMPPRPPPISRFSAPEISSETSGVAFAISVAARVSMPSRLRNSPCGMGPWTRAPMSSAARTSA